MNYKKKIFHVENVSAEKLSKKFKTPLYCYSYSRLKHNIVNLLKTVPGERLGQPAFGSLLQNILFEPMDDEIGDGIEEAIRETLTKWLPYISITNIEVTQPEYDNNRVNVAIDFGLAFEPDRFESVSIDFEQFESAIKE